MPPTLPGGRSLTGQRETEGPSKGAVGVAPALGVSGAPWTRPGCEHHGYRWQTLSELPPTATVVGRWVVSHLLIEILAIASVNEPLRSEASSCAATELVGCKHHGQPLVRVSQGAPGRHSSTGGPGHLDNVHASCSRAGRRKYLTWLCLRVTL
jgi:hypothetical protein